MPFWKNVGQNVGRAMGIGGIKQIPGGIAGLGGGGGQMGGAFGQLADKLRQQAPQRIAQARSGFEQLAQRPGPHGALARGWLAKNPAQTPQAQPMQQMGQPPAQPGVIQQGLAQMLQPQQPDSGYSDPYEAWKAGGRQGQRP